MILVGGVIPAIDFPQLREMGVANVFGPGSMVADIVSFISENVKK
jgi:methylmalonyl-CoA mutase C-terminal domain/subunit